MSRIQNPSSFNEESGSSTWNPESTARNIQNPRTFPITLHGVIPSSYLLLFRELFNVKPGIYVPQKTKLVHNRNVYPIYYDCGVIVGVIFYQLQSGPGKSSAVHHNGQYFLVPPKPIRSFRLTCFNYFQVKSPSRQLIFWLFSPLA